MGGENLSNLIDLNKLKKYMKENGITEYRLSKEIGISYAMVYRVFRGQRNPGGKFINGLIKSKIDNKFFLTLSLPSGKEIAKDTS